MKKLLISIILGCSAALFIMGEVLINLTSICIFLGLAALAYYVLFVQGKSQEVEILEEYSREQEDPEEILP